MSRLLRKVNQDESCDNYDDVTVLRKALPWDHERVTYISTRWEVNRNRARALILSELGLSNKEIAQLLYLTKETVKKYMREWCRRIDPDVIMPIEYKYRNGIKYDVWGSGETTKPRATDSNEQLDPKFSPRERPLKKELSFIEAVEALQ